VLGLTHIDHQVKFQWVAKEKNWRLQMHVAMSHNLSVDSKWI
jgi:hypothetical protein